jgi:hypothetical protein
MAITFEKSQAGMTLWVRGRQGGRPAEWLVIVKDVCPEDRTALVSFRSQCTTAVPWCGARR